MIKRVALIIFCLTLAAWNTESVAGENHNSVPPSFSFSSGTDINDKGTHGLPEPLAAQQFFEAAPIPSLGQALVAAEKAAQEAVRPFLQVAHNGKRHVVPDDFATIQAALTVAQAGDSVIVRPGIYYEQLLVKAGVRLVSEAGAAGNGRVAVEGAGFTLPQRSLLTIIDGSRALPSAQGMLDFEPGSGRDTVVDGFTIQNLPEQSHHIPGHAHAINLRGASPLIINCLLQDNGSTGIGSHVVYNDQQKEMNKRDFRKKNIKFQASAVLYGNIIRRNLGRGIGCNHFATPFILGNEVMENDDSKLGEDGPGIGIMHGAAPMVVGNYVHHNPGGGILSRYGAAQGLSQVDFPPSPVIKGNVVIKNGKKRPAISGQGVGSKENPFVVSGNFISGFGALGIGFGENAYGVIENNIISDGKMAGVAITHGTALRVNNNTVVQTNTGFMFVGMSKILELKGNRVFKVSSKPFIVRFSEVAGVKIQ